VKIRKRLIVYIVILVILVAALLVLFLSDRNNKNTQSSELESATQSFLDKAKSESGNLEYAQEIDNASLNANSNSDFNSVFSNNTNTVQSITVNNSSKVVKISGHTVLGVITISKIGIKYPIIQYTDQNSLNIAICKYSDDKKLNDLGNVAIVGHNMSNGLMFHNLDKLSNGDVIQITDATGQTITYQVNSSYVIEPTDTDCLKTTDASKRTITLITCVTGDFSKRLVVTAAEIS